MQTPHSALLRDAGHRPPALTLLDGLLDTRTHDEHIIYRQATPISGKATLGTPNRSHYRFHAVAVREMLLVRRELAPNRLGARRAHAPQQSLRNRSAHRLRDRPVL